MITEATANTAATESDQDLARAARSDFDAFEQLYRRYVTRVYRYCFARTSNAADAEDLTAQTFLAALEAIGSYRGSGSFKAWLFGIAWRKCQEHHRRRYRHQEATGEVARLQHARQDGDAVEKQAYQQELLDCVQRQWRLLSEDRREVLLLRFWAGLNTAETAELMGRRRGAVKMLLSRAIADIRERCLDE